MTSVDEVLAAAPPPPHRHKTPELDPATGDIVLFGNEDCARCLADSEADNAAAKDRRQIEQVLAALPAGREGSRPCRCDGSGMVDDRDSLAALRSIDQLPRFVYPCPVCNQDAWQRWRAGDLAATKG